MIKVLSAPSEEKLCSRGFGPELSLRKWWLMFLRQPRFLKTCLSTVPRFCPAESSPVINTAAMQPGSNAVVIGCGGVGLNCLQGAKIVGADPLIAVDLHPDKLQTAMEFGATHAFSSTEEDLSEIIRTLTQGRGADYVFVSVGNIQAMLQGFELLRRAGTLVVAGMTGVGEKLPLEAIDIGDNAVRIIGSKMGSTDLKRDMPQWIRH